MSLLSRLFAKPAIATEPPGGLHCWMASPELPVELMMELIQRSPPCLWPSQPVPRYGLWHEWPNVQAAHRELMKRFVASLRPYPADAFSGRGIVICAGGWRFFPSVYVNVRLIRHVGCTLPIELWYLGALNEFDERMGWILRDYGPIVWRDANAVARELGLEPRHLGSQADGYPPWEIKPFAVLHSAFREVLSLDADSYPVRDPSFLFDAQPYLQSGALFWPDRVGPVPANVWSAFGLKRSSDPQFESGQFVVDKAKCWSATNLAWWLNEHRDYVYRIPGLYGDKETFNVAWRHTKTPFVFPWRQPAFVENTYLQADFEGRTLFQHRTHNKFRLKDERFKSHQSGATRYSPLLRHDNMAKSWMRELDELVYPKKYFRLRDGTTDQDVWDECVTRNEYRLPARMDGAVVIDVGANVGAFTHAVLERGAKMVYAVEPEPGNVQSLQRNLQRWRERVKLLCGACWAGTRVRKVGLRALAPVHGKSMAAQYAVTGIDYEGARHETASVRTIRFDTLVKRAYRRHGAPIVVKVDAEGSEYPILCTSRVLDKVTSIYGEYHRVEWRGRSWGPDDLRGALEAAGFMVTFAGNGQHDMFWATRP